MNIQQILALAMAVIVIGLLAAQATGFMDFLGTQTDSTITGMEKLRDSETYGGSTN